MSRWHAVRIRDDLYRAIQAQAAADARSIAQMTDRLLTGALEQETGIEHSGPSPAASSPARAPAGFTYEHTTVDEMLASCPQCAGAFVEHETDDGADTLTLCEDCGFVREPS